MNDEKEGYGVYNFISGDVYKGEFVQSQKNGKGIYYFANGEVFQGQFKNDTICK